MGTGSEVIFLKVSTERAIRMSDFVNVKPMKYPTSHLGMLARFPWKLHWNHSKFFRCHIYSVILCLPLFYAIDKAVNSPDNVMLWAKKRAKNAHDPFETLDHRKDL